MLLYAAIERFWFNVPFVRMIFASRTVQIVLVCLLFAILVTLQIAQKLPSFDEGGNANVPYNLLNHGHLGMPIWLQQRENWPGTELYTYYILPVSILLEAAWFGVFGFGVFQMRALSALFGLIIVLSIYCSTKRVSGHHSLALLAALFVSTDYNVTVSAGDGRMDIMCAGFGFAAIACYLLLREARLGWAILVSQTLIVFSGLTHPAGILYFCAVLALIVYYDRKRIGLIHVVLGLVPYTVGALAWGAYILQNVEVFRGQFFSAFAGRSFRFDDLSAFGISRYLSAAFGIGPDVPALGRLKIFQLIAFWGAVLVYLLYRPVRNESHIQALAILLLVVVLSMIVFTPGEQLLYLVHIVPFYAIVLTAVLWYFLRYIKLLRLPVLVLIAGLIAVQAGGPIIKFATDNRYQNAWLPVVERLKELRRPGDVVIASAEFGFAFGYEGEVVDDFRLGTYFDYVGDIVVIGNNYHKVYSEMKQRDPEAYQRIFDRLNTMYDQVFDGVEYDIYVLKKRRGESAYIVS